jgi:DNA-binding LytR/AlgR family response regulator
MKILAPNSINIGARTEVLPQELLMLKGDTNYTIVHFANGTKLTVATSLKKLEARLLPFNFFRTHKTFLVNMDCVIRFCEFENMIQLNDNQHIMVSRRKLSSLKQFLFQANLK